MAWKKEVYRNHRADSQRTTYRVLKKLEVFDMTKNSKKRRIFSIIILALLCIVLLLAYLQVITTNVKFICLAFLVDYSIYTFLKLKLDMKYGKT